VSEERRYVGVDGRIDTRRLTHDLRAPLNGILGFARLLQDGRAGAVSDAQREMLADVLEGGQTLLLVVERLERETRGATPAAGA
jgi:signal transduction histidine kinase